MNRNPPQTPIYQVSRVRKALAGLDPKPNLEIELAVGHLEARDTPYGGIIRLITCRKAFVCTVTVGFTPHIGV